MNKQKQIYIYCKIYFFYISFKINLNIIIILIINNKEFRVIVNGGDTQLGGEDIDNWLVNHCINKFK